MILLFNTCAAPHLAARLHADDCEMVRMARGSRGKVKVISQDLEFEVSDLNDRGYAVKECKCLRLSPSLLRSPPALGLLKVQP
jgi:hypothetical protein